MSHNYIKNYTIPHFAKLFYKKYARATKTFCRIYGVDEKYITQKYLIIPQFRSTPPDYYPWQYLKAAIKFIDETLHMYGPTWSDEVYTKQVCSYMKNFKKKYHN